MAVRHGYGKVAGTDALVFAYDTGDTVNSYKGEPTENLITQMAGSTTISYPEVRYRCNEVEANVIDPSAPGGQYSRFTGQSLGNESNNQLYSRFNTANIDVRNQTVTYSVYLKGSGTCHLTIYADNAGYSTSSSITLTSTWTRYQYTTTPTNYTTNCWVAVRGILPTTDVYIAAQQAELNSHATQFVNGTRSNTEGLLDLTGNSSIDLSNVSFDSNADIDLDGTDDSIETADSSLLDLTTDMSFEFVVNADSSQGNLFPRLIDKSVYLVHLTQTSPFTIAQNITTSGGLRQIIVGSAFAAGVYTHIVTTYDGRYGQIFVNGELKYTKDFSTELACNTNSTSVKIGGDGSTNRPLNGKLPVSKIYNRALTADEVRNNYRHYKNRFGI